MVRVIFSLFAVATVATSALASEPELKFELYKDKTNDYRWRLKDSEGTILAIAATGQKEHADAKSGLDTFRKSGTSGDLRFDVFFDESKQYRWRLVSSKGETVAVSHGAFRAEGDAERAIASLKIGVDKAGLVVLK